MNRPESVSLPSPYFREEHELLRAQMRRFVETEIKPHGLKWEEQGYVPREVLRRMGELGFLGIRYPAEYGGSEMDTLGSVVLAEELGRSTFSRRRDHHAGAHRHGLGAHGERRLGRAEGALDAGDRRRAARSRAVAVTEPDAGSDVKASAPPRAATATTTCSTAPRCSSPTACTPTFISSPRRPRPTRGPRSRSRCSWSRRARPASASAARSTSTAGAPPTPPSSSFEDCRIPAENLLGKEGRGFYAIMSNFQNERTVIGAMAMGEAQAALELTLDYVTTRKAFGAHAV